MTNEAGLEFGAGEKVEIKKIIDDTRLILQIYNCIPYPENEDNGFWFRVGSHHVTKIVAYQEAGEMAHVTWFAIYKDLQIVCRVPASACIIQYALNSAVGAS